MGLALAQLADEVGVNERTLRRAAATGLIRAPRTSPRRLSLSGAEAGWIRSHWPLVGQLRAALRTEPSVALAVVFGSVARGDEVRGASDVDLMVDLRQASGGALQALSARLAERVGQEVQVVPLGRAQDDPLLMAEILRDGRPLVDRDEAWPLLRARSARTGEQAAVAQRALRAEAREALEYFKRLAAQHGSSLADTES